MSDTIHPDILARLRAIADYEQRGIDDVLEDLLATYPSVTPPEQPPPDDERETPPASEPWGQAVVRPDWEDDASKGVTPC